MQRGYLVFLGILSAAAAVLVAVYSLVLLGLVQFTLQLCGKNGSCTQYPDPWSYLVALVRLSAVAGALAAVALGIAVFFVRRLRGPKDPPAPS